MNLTEFQKAQLLYLHFSGEFRFRNRAGNKYPRKAFAKMVDTLLANNLIDDNCLITKQGNAFLGENHLEIRLSILN